MKLIDEEKDFHSIWIDNVDKETNELEHLQFDNSYPYPKLLKKINQLVVKYGKDLFPLFNCINIETTSWCNMNCSFCPSIYLNREKRNMTNELFIKIIKELKDMQYNGEIRLHQSNEPLTDKYIISKVRFVKSMIPKATVGMHSNTLLMTYETLEKLYKSGLNFLAAEAYISENQFNKLYIMFKTLEDKYKDVILHIQDKDGKYSFSKIKQTKYKPKGFFITLSRRYKKTSEDSFFDYNKSKITSRIGIIDSHIKCKKTNICTRPFRSMQVNFNGKVVVCCEEWLYNDESIVGDLNKNSIVEIWNGKPFMEFRNNLQNGIRTKYPCSECNFHGGIFTKMIRRVEL